MQVVTTVREMIDKRSEWARTDKKIGFVPTMGYLHEGHLSLVRCGRAENDVLVASIFVNPTQFAAHEDLGSYPHDMPRDLHLLETAGVDVVLTPTPNEIYPPAFVTYVEPTGPLAVQVEGASRPGHFRGVATVVLKMFQIVQPYQAYFGQKDAQQVAVIARMVTDLNLAVKLRILPTIRESDGLAMSSRNTYLDPEARATATVLYRALQAGRQVFETTGDPSTVVLAMADVVAAEPRARLDYAEVRDPDSFLPLATLHAPALLLIAARIGQARLIDNFLLRADGSWDTGVQSGGCVSLGGACPPYNLCVNKMNLRTEERTAMRDKITVPLVQARKGGAKLKMVTAYDAPSAQIADRAEADIILVGDSLATTVLGYDDTLPVTMDIMIHHTAAVTRTNPKALVVGDMPWLSYHLSVEETVRNAGRLLREGRADAVKLEGGSKRLTMIEALLAAEIPVMGHLGLTPQSIRPMGGYRVQGKQVDAAYELEADAHALAEVGVFALVLEGIPDVLAQIITAAVPIPTIGIGAGPHCDGQVLVFHDVLGLQHGRQPKFVRQYAHLADLATDALKQFFADVQAGSFPSNAESYHMNTEAAQALQALQKHEE